MILFSVRRFVTSRFTSTLDASRCRHSRFTSRIDTSRCHRSKAEFIQPIRNGFAENAVAQLTKNAKSRCVRVFSKCHLAVTQL